MKLAWAVAGHPDRERQAAVLAWVVGGDLIMDTGHGEWDTHSRAWNRLSRSDSEFAICLQDDALPVAQIVAQAEQALAVAPAPLVSLYLGTSYPQETVRPFVKAMTRAESERAGWITARRLFWGVAVAIRTELVPDMLRVCERLTKIPYDQRLSYWAQFRGGVAYTWPSLVDHADGVSLVGHRTVRSKPRVAYRVGVGQDWARSVKL